MDIKIPSDPIDLVEKLPPPLELSVDKIIKANESYTIPDKRARRVLVDAKCKNLPNCLETSGMDSITINLKAIVAHRYDGVVSALATPSSDLTTVDQTTYKDLEVYWLNHYIPGIGPVCLYPILAQIFLKGYMFARVQLYMGTFYGRTKVLLASTGRIYVTGCKCIEHDKYQCTTCITTPTSYAHITRLRDLAQTVILK